MNLVDLLRECDRSVSAARDEDRQGHVILKVKSKSRSGQVRLCGRRGPLGRVVGSHEDGTLVVDFMANDIVIWLEKIGARQRVADGEAG